MRSLRPSTMSAIRHGPGFTGPVLTLGMSEAGKASFMRRSVAPFGQLQQLAGGNTWQGKDALSPAIAGRVWARQVPVGESWDLS
jgi:hypothetical protein